MSEFFTPLNDQQIYLINALSYDLDGFAPGTPVSDIADSLLASTSDPDLRKACELIKKDDALCSMQLRATDTTSTDSARYVFTTSGETKEAVVLYRGTTSPAEWKDNFLGGGHTDAADGVSTPCQEDALSWYQSSEVQGILSECNYVTTTGHSKGGNDAKYVTLLDGTVDRCVSINGQGFSDEFLAKYGNEIALRQNKITNYSAEKDPVNILLNDVGREHIYLKTRNAEGFEYHGILNFVDTLPFSEHIGKQDPGMQLLNEVLNSHLRTLDPVEKRETLSVIGELAAIMLNEDATDAQKDAAMKAFMSDKRNMELTSDLVASIIAYCDLHPECIDLLVDTLTDLVPSLGGIIEWAIRTLLTGLTDHSESLSDQVGGIRGKLLNVITGTGIRNETKVGGSLIAIILAVFNKKGTKYDFVGKVLLDAIGKYEDVNLGPGADRKVKAVEDTMKVDCDYLFTVAQNLSSAASTLESVASQIKSTASLCNAQNMRFAINAFMQFRFLPRTNTGAFGTPGDALNKLGNDARNLAAEVSKLSAVVKRVQTSLESTEERVTGMFKTS